ncbi:MAG: hypothetical protein LBU66_06600, partial [Treponema sp.]|nr:hypothetical protein [Treponema sp.]
MVYKTEDLSARLQDIKSKFKKINMFYNKAKKTKDEATGFFTEGDIDPEKLIESEATWESALNKDGSFQFFISSRVGEPVEPEIFYSDGENALFRRNLNQFILLENVHESFRETLCEKSELLITEILSLEERNELKEKDGGRGIVREYKAKIRPVPEKIESKESIVRDDGYLLFTSLRARLYAHKDKPVTKLINKDNYVDLAAVLAREEDYEQLERAAGLWSSETLNKTISATFRDWQPTPLYYITSYRIWPTMKDPKKMIHWFVKHGTDPNTESGVGSTPLYNQCISKESHVTGEGFPFYAYEILKTLLEAGADPNKESGEDGILMKPINVLLFPDNYSDETLEFTPFCEGYLKRLELLIKYGAQPDGVSLAQALTFSEGENRQKFVKIIIDKGVTIDDAVNSLENLASAGIPIYYRTLYDLYHKGEYVTKDEARAQEYLAHFKDSEGIIFHNSALELFNRGLYSQAFIEFKKAYKLSHAYPEAARLPMPVSNRFKELCVSKGWHVFQRLSICGDLYPLTLIGNMKVVLVIDAPDRKEWVDRKDITPDEIPLRVANLLYESNHLLELYKIFSNEKLEVIPVALVFTQDAPSLTMLQAVQICEGVNGHNLRVINAGDVCGNSIPCYSAFEEFIEELGQQAEMSQEVLDKITLAVVGIVDDNDSDKNETE